MPAPHVLRGIHGAPQYKFEARRVQTGAQCAGRDVPGGADTRQMERSPQPCDAVRRSSAGSASGTRRGKPLDRLEMTAVIDDRHTKPWPGHARRRIHDAAHRSLDAGVVAAGVRRRTFEVDTRSARGFIVHDVIRCAAGRLWRRVAGADHRGGASTPSARGPRGSCRHPPSCGAAS